MKHPSSRLAELQRAPPAWKFCAVQSQERFDRENAQRADQAKMNGRRFFDCRKWTKAKKTSARGRNRAVTTRKDREEVEVLRGSLHGVARVLSCICDSRRLSSCLAADGGHAPGLANKWVFERPRRSRTRPSIQTWIQAAKQI